jgi:hypothetical protein
MFKQSKPYLADRHVQNSLQKYDEFFFASRDQHCFKKSSFFSPINGGGEEKFWLLLITIRLMIK